MIMIGNQRATFSALTVIDTVTNLVELTRMNNRTAESAKQKLAQSWLAHYPWPQRCIHDRGGEFIGEPFQ